MIEPDFYMGEYQRDSLFMMCSDGFRHVITPEEFYEKSAARDHGHRREDERNDCIFYRVK